MNIFANLGNIFNQSQSQNQKPVVCSCLQPFLILILILTLAFDFEVGGIILHFQGKTEFHQCKVKNDFSQAKNQICKVKPKFGRQIFLSNEALHNNDSISAVYTDNRIR